MPDRVGLVPPPVEPGDRAGIGFDAHRLEAGRPLRLGGLAFPNEPRGLAGHSDGDAVLHALIDAMLGAAHLGDIGTLYPPDDARWAGIDSGELVRDTMGRLDDVGLQLERADLTVVAARPAIAPLRGAMEARIGALTGVAPDRISVKGTTSDGLGFTGEDGIAAYAIAVLRPVG
jgi:2-C-methyl-D-erythritol 2,4-cyclodiphosphate synthase